MTRVLVTGATGALGTAVIAELKKFGHKDIFATTTKKDAILDDNVTVCLCDIRDIKQLTQAFDTAKPDLILHLAASFTDDLSEAYQTNVTPAKNLLEIVLDRKLNTRVVLTGSAAEYGAVTPEENPVTESHALNPVSVYGVSKAWQTQLLGIYTTQKVEVVCARIFNLFGPGLSERLFAGRIQNQIKAIKEGHKSVIEVGPLCATRDYLSTEEAARQILMIASHGVAGNIYHVGSGIPTTMLDFLIQQLKLNGLSQSCIQESPAYSNRHGFDVPIIYANMQKTRSLEYQGIKNV